MFKKPALLALIGITTAVFYSTNVFAYSEKTTHPALTAEIVDFYNLTHGGSAISEEEKAWLMEGSVLEDTPPRWINHFYDPIYNIAWTGENAGSLSPEQIQKWVDAVIWGDEPLPSTDWVNNEPAQESYLHYGGNRTWKKALKYWADGNKEEAYRTLGYILHLIEDAGVPEHTRNDIHAEPVEFVTGDPGSPLEQYASNWSPQNFKEWGTAKSLAQEGAAIPGLRSIEDYIISTARYSNKYFFSKDTINDPKYEFPKIVKEDSVFGYGLDEKIAEFPLVRVVNTKEARNYIIDQNDDSILSAYFSRLSRQIVLHGAGAIDLLYQQGADAIINKEFSNKLVVTSDGARETLNFAANFDKVSAVGELDKIINLAYAAGSFFESTALSIANFFGDLGGLTIAIYDKFIATVGPGQTTVTPRSDEAATSTPSQPERTEEPAPVPPPITASPIAQETIIDNPEPSNPTSSPAVLNSQGLVAGTSTPAGASPPEADPPLAETSSADTAPAPIVWGVSGTPAPTGGVSVSGGSPTPGDGGETPPNSTSTGELPPPEEPPSEPPPTLPVIENFAGEFNLNELAIDFSWTPLTIETEIYALSLVGSTGSPQVGVEPILVATTTENSLTVEIPAWGGDLVYSLQAFGVSTSSADTEESPAAGELEPISEIATVTVEIPDWLITVQGDASGESAPSHYGDNWYNLGTNFFGTIYAITLKGHINGTNPTVGDTRVYIEEFLNENDGNYGALNKTFTISEDAPFEIGDPQTLTFKGLNIPVQPNKFYRLLTDHGEQNLSLILSGSATAEPAEFSGGGTAMWNEFISAAAGGSGRTEHTYDFYPFLQVVAELETPPQAAPTAPEILLPLDFSETSLSLGVTWASSTDADTGDNLITYEFNYSTSTPAGESALSADGWRTASGFSYGIGLEYPNSYTVGVRAKDDQGNTSPVSVETWNFPEGFVPLVLSARLNTASQTFTPAIGGTLSSITVHTANFTTPSKNANSNICSLDLYEVSATSSVLIAHNDEPNTFKRPHFAYSGSDCAGALVFTYADAPPELSTDKTYKWVFSITFSGSVKFYGYAESTIDGEFSDTSTVADAKFTVLGTGGTLIEN